MDTYCNYHREASASVRKRRRRRRRCRGIVPVIVLSVVLAVLIGLAVRISVFGKISQVDSVLDPSTGEHIFASSASEHEANVAKVTQEG